MREFLFFFKERGSCSCPFLPPPTWEPMDLHGMDEFPIPGEPRPEETLNITAPKPSPTPSPIYHYSPTGSEPFRSQKSPLSPSDAGNLLTRPFFGPVFGLGPPKRASTRKKSRPVRCAETEESQKETRARRPRWDYKTQLQMKAPWPWAG